MSVCNKIKLYVGTKLNYILALHVDLSKPLKMPFKRCYIDTRLHKCSISSQYNQTRLLA